MRGIFAARTGKDQILEESEPIDPLLAHEIPAVAMMDVLPKRKGVEVG